eukprot:4618854-Ditylum_brightwellii.AAC.1
MTYLKEALKFWSLSCYGIDCVRRLRPAITFPSAAFWAKTNFRSLATYIAYIDSTWPQYHPP